MIDLGVDGYIVKKSGAIIKDLAYIVLEYVEGELLFDFIQNWGSMGEDNARFFFN